MHSLAAVGFVQIKQTYRTVVRYVAGEFCYSQALFLNFLTVTQGSQALHQSLDFV